MGNSCVTVLNKSEKNICVICFNNLDMLYADYYNDEMFVIPPGEFCNVSAIASTYGLQAAIITDVHPTEHYYSFDLWWVKTGATLTVTAVDFTDRVVIAHGVDCESYGRGKQLYDMKRLTNLRMCLNIFKYYNYNSEDTADISPPDPAITTISTPNFLCAPFLLVDNSHGTSAVKIMNVDNSFASFSSDANNSITDIATPFVFRNFAPDTVKPYAYIGLPGHTQIIWPEDWDLPINFFSILALKHLRLYNSNRYTFVMDPGLNRSTVVVTSLLRGKEYMKIVPMTLGAGDARNSNSQVLRLVLVLNVLLSCFQPDSDPYLAVRQANACDSSSSSSSSSLLDLRMGETTGGRGQGLSPPSHAAPDMAAALPAWFAFCDASNSGCLSQEEIVEGLRLSFAKDLDESTVDGMRRSLAAIWSQVFGDAIDFEASETANTSDTAVERHEAIHRMKISLEVFMEEDGIGPTLAEYIYPLHRGLDLLFQRVEAVASPSRDSAGRCILTLESGCAITRQHIYNILLAQHGDADETWQILQQMHPSIPALASSSNVTATPTPIPAATTTSPSQSPPPAPPLPQPQASCNVVLDDYTSLTHPAVRVCALAARDIYSCTSGNVSDDESGVVSLPPPPPPSGGTGDAPLLNDQIQWLHISSGKLSRFFLFSFLTRYFFYSMT